MIYSLLGFSNTLIIALFREDVNLQIRYLYKLTILLFCFR